MAQEQQGSHGSGCRAGDPCPTAQRLEEALRAAAPRGGEGGGGAKRRAEQLEADNASLRRENEYLRQQRDILKKTLGILSEPPTSALNGLTR